MFLKEENWNIIKIS